jgi:TRAP transporter 4TM/12TM fusion protein
MKKYMKYKQIVIGFLAAVFSLMFIYQAATGIWEAHLSRGTYVLFTLVLAFLKFPVSSKKQNFLTEAIDLVLAALSAFCVAYFMYKFPEYAMTAGRPLQQIDLIVGVLTVLLILEASRRTVGLSLTIICVVFILYVFYGRSLPPIISHRGYDLNRLIANVYASTDGIYGSVAYIFSTFVFLFIIFGQFLQNSGAAKFYIDLSKATVGWITGGPAQAAVIASTILGSIMGSSTANTAITGAITIPLMIEKGYKRHVAAAVESVVSIGGQFMPPIMGAAAFLMAAFLGIPYVEIVKAAIIPAILFTFSMVFMVYFEAKRYNLEGIPRSELPRVIDVLKSGWQYFIPIVVIVFYIAKGYSPSLAGFWSIISVIVVSMFKKEDRMGLKKIYNSLAEGAQNSLVMAVTACIVGIIITTISLPGLGMKFSMIILQIAGDSLPLAILMVMIASFILGMGMNVTSAYLLLVTLSAPALVQMGVPLIAAHFFVFWTSQLSVITPPVCTAAFVGAAIAKADPWKTGWYSLRMGLAIYYIPILFIYNPYLLAMGPALLILKAFATAMIGIFSFSALSQGYMLTKLSILERVLLFVSSFGLLVAGTVSDILGLVILVIVIIIQIQKIKKEKATVSVTTA